MSRAQLEQSLEALRRELNRIDPADAHLRTRLMTLVDEIEQELDALEGEGENESMIEKVRHQVEEFEVEHPRVTTILNDIMVTLSNMGI